MLQHAQLLGLSVKSVANNEPVQNLLGEGKRDKPAVVIHFILQGCDGYWSEKPPTETIGENWKMALELPESDTMREVAGVIIYSSQ